MPLSVQCIKENMFDAIVLMCFFLTVADLDVFYILRLFMKICFDPATAYFDRAYLHTSSLIRIAKFEWLNKLSFFSL